jgi:hypothetical protein
MQKMYKNVPANKLKKLTSFDCSSLWILVAYQNKILVIGARLVWHIYGLEQRGRNI